MALISMRQLLDHAAENNYGVPAFNVNNLEQVQAIMQAADETGSPVIMQASAGARKYAGEPFLRHLILAAVESYPHIPVVMHQDHGASPAVCQRSIRSGFSSVMMDGSLKEDMKTPADYDYNVRVTQQVVGLAHAVGVSVEGELGCLGSLETMSAGKEDGSGAEGALTHDMLLTDPDQAADFVNQTHVDALAIAIGTSHGAYKFSRKPTGDILAIGRIKAIHQRIPNTHLVMHGSSSVPQDWLKVIRDNGGEMKVLRRAGGGDPGRHQARGAQDQHRHRHPAGHERGDPACPEPRQGRIRSTQVPEGRHAGGQSHLQGAHGSLRHRRPGGQTQTHPARHHGREIRQGRNQGGNPVNAALPEQQAHANQNQNQNRRHAQFALEIVENVGLMVIAVATVFAGYAEDGGRSGGSQPGYAKG